MAPLALTFLGALLLAALLTAGVRALALKHQLLDVPNPRSSHAAPTPLGGGLAIVLVVCASLVFLPLDGGVGFGPGLVVALAGLAVAIIGFVDDRHGVPKWTRLVVHAVTIAVLIETTREIGSLQVPGLPATQWLNEVVALVALMWLVNLFNFMDGIDGIAAVEAASVSLGLAACVGSGSGAAAGLQLLCLATAGASLGFLIWNWPPARIFMGDVGSGFLGFLLGALALVAHRETGLSLWAPAILLAVFVTDATVTLVRRMVRRERWYESHRTHAYQWLSRRFGSHRTVTLGVLALNVIWLLPLAVAAARRPEIAGILAAVAYVPLIVAALLAGAGRPETAAHRAESG